MFHLSLINYRVNNIFTNLYKILVYVLIFTKNNNSLDLSTPNISVKNINQLHFYSKITSYTNHHFITTNSQYNLNTSFTKDWTNYESQLIFIVCFNVLTFICRFKINIENRFNFYYVLVNTKKRVGDVITNSEKYQFIMHRHEITDKNYLSKRNFKTAHACATMQKKIDNKNVTVTSLRVHNVWQICQ